VRCVNRFFPIEAGCQFVEAAPELSETELRIVRSNADALIEIDAIAVLDGKK